MERQRILKDFPATIYATFSDGASNLVADGAVTVAITNSAGTAVASGTATPTDDRYAFTLPAQGYETLTAAWTGTFSGVAGTVYTEVAVVGGFLFTLPELRGYDLQLRGVKYSDSALLAARDFVEDEFERECHRGLVPSFARETVSADGGADIWLSHPEIIQVLSITDAGGNVTDYEIAGSLPILWRAAGWSGSIDVTYLYGMRTVPKDLKDAALYRAKNKLMSGNSRIDERATMMSVPDFGTFNLATAGRGGYRTGLPVVDAVLNDYDLNPGGVA